MVDSIVRTNEMMTLPLEHGVCRTILPKQPSLLLRVAIMDARTLNRTMYSPQWARYHEPNRGGGPCWVCFAGAAMAGSLGVAHNEHVRPEDLGANKDQLRALDSMRDGEWREAFAQLGIPPDFGASWIVGGARHAGRIGCFTRGASLTGIWRGRRRIMCRLLSGLDGRFSSMYKCAKEI